VSETTAQSPDPPAPPPPPPAALLPALALFERGDFPAAGRAAQALAGDADPEVAAAARALLARLSPDPWAVRLGLLAVILLAVVAAVYVR
jgi:hypothetical protein